MRTPQSGYPRYLHEPYWTTPPRHPKAQNTDPYVFGHRFPIQQLPAEHQEGPMRTQRLAAGSIILFGSGLRGEFVLDTVFVVAHAQTLSPEKVPELRATDEAFTTVTIAATSTDSGVPRSRSIAQGVARVRPVGCLIPTLKRRSPSVLRQWCPSFEHHAGIYLPWFRRANAA
jgi:hypothetical protein